MSNRTPMHGLAAAAIVVLTAVAFAPILDNEFVSWGDQAELVMNQHYKGFSPENLQWMFTTINKGHYQPLTWLSFALDYSIWGASARAYHLTSLLLHTGCAIVAYFLILELLRAAQPKPQTARMAGCLAAAIGALLFAVHPLRVEIVAWAAERRGVLSGLFYLLAVWSYLRYHAAADTSAVARRQSGLAIAFLFFALSLLSKEFGISLPLVLLVLDVYPLRRSGPAVLWEKWPFLGLAALGAVMAMKSSAQSGVAKSLADYGPLQRLAQCAWGLVFYPAKTLLPTDLSPLYPIPLHLDPFRWTYLLSAVIVILAAVTLVLLRRRLAALVACAVCYVVIVTPVLGLVQTGRQMAADRYSYLPAVGGSALASWALLRMWDPGRRSVVRFAAAVVALAAVAALTPVTRAQVRVWRDSLTLWTHALRLYPDDATINANLGVALGNAGRLEDAAARFQAAIAHDPAFVDAYNNLGSILAMQQRLDEAIRQWSASLQIDPNQPAVRRNIERARSMIDERR